MEAVAQVDLKQVSILLPCPLNVSNLFHLRPHPTPLPCVVGCRPDSVCCREDSEVSKSLHSKKLFDCLTSYNIFTDTW